MSNYFDCKYIQKIPEIQRDGYYARVYREQFAGKIPTPKPKPIEPEMEPEIDPKEDLENWGNLETAKSNEFRILPYTQSDEIKRLEKENKKLQELIVSLKSEDKNKNKEKQLLGTIQHLQSLIRSSEPVCKICYEKPIQMVFSDCNHACCCESCSTKLKQCPICRKRISSMLRIVFS